MFPQAPCPAGAGTEGLLALFLSFFSAPGAVPESRGPAGAALTLPRPSLPRRSGEEHGAAAMDGDAGAAAGNDSFLYFTVQ